MKKKLLSMWTLVLALLLVITGCSSNSGSNSSSDAENSNTPANSSSSNSTGTGKQVTLDYALWDTNQAKGLRVIADEFEAANPNIKININVSGWGEYWTMLEASATGGSLPDVFWMHSNEFYRYASNDMLYDLTELAANSDSVEMDKFPEGLVSLYQHNDKQLAIPKDYDTIGLWYNKTLFDEANLSYPDENWTWDDLYEAAKVLTKDGVYGLLAPLSNQEGYYNFIYQNGGTVITDQKTSGYDDPKTIEALEFYINFVREGLSPEIYGDGETVEAIQNGLGAMGIFGSWQLSGFNENEFMKNNFDVAVLPKKEKQASIFNGLGHAIAHNTSHPEEAWKFVEYLSSKQGQDRQSELGIAISAYKGSDDLWVSSNTNFNVKSFIDMVDYAVIRPYSNTTAVWEDKVQEALKHAFTGSKTVQEVAQEAAKVMNESLSTEK